MNGKAQQEATSVDDQPPRTKRAKGLRGRENEKTKRKGGQGQKNKDRRMLFNTTMNSVEQLDS